MSRKKKLSVGVGTTKEALVRFEAVWKRAERGVRLTPEHRLTFESLPQLLKELSPGRWTLLEALRAEGKMTMYALAKRLGRHYKNVHTDVARLIEFGLIEKTKDGKLKLAEKMPPQIKLDLPIIFSPMSYGSISLNAQKVLATAAKACGIVMNTG